MALSYIQSRFVETKASTLDFTRDVKISDTVDSIVKNSTFNGFIILRVVAHRCFPGRSIEITIPRWENHWHLVMPLNGTQTITANHSDVELESGHVGVMVSSYYTPKAKTEWYCLVVVGRYPE
jgi:hypothetical protein